MTCFRRLPPHLDSNSTGDGVNCLIEWFQHHFSLTEEVADSVDELLPNGQYTEHLVHCMIWLQEHIGMDDQAANGFYGPQTAEMIRIAMMENSLFLDYHPEDQQMQPDAITHYYSPKSNRVLVWNEEAAREARAFVELTNTVMVGEEHTTSL